MGAGQGQAFNFKKEYLQLIKVKKVFKLRKVSIVLPSFHCLYEL